MEKESRKLYVDLLKILAIILVIFIHTGDSGFFAYQKQGNVYLRILELCIMVYSKTAVPLFFMCSGILLLGKTESVKEILKKRVCKYLIVIIVFTILYYIVLSVQDGGQININWILRTMYSSTTFSFSGAYWFLYAYVTFLLMLPVLRVIAQQMKPDGWMYLLSLYTVFGGGLQIFEKCMGLEEAAISVPFISYQSIFYPLCGYMLEKNWNVIKRKKTVLLAGGLAAVSLITNVSMTLLAFQQGETSKTYYLLFSAYMTFFTYLAVRKFCEKIQHRFGNTLKKVICQISEYTFGMYLLHGYVLMIMNQLLKENRYYEAWIKVVCAFVISLFVTAILRKIPVINKLL